MCIRDRHEALAPIMGDISLNDFKEHHLLQSQKVGPTIAHDIKKGALYAILFALLLIFIYIFFRFKNWQYGLGATVALIHDSIIVLGIFSLLYKILPFSLEIDQAFIAAILTVVGYSVNDTVIIFDRIREFINLHPKRDRELNTNNALNSTLSRTLNTSLTTFFVLLVIFLFGGAVIKGFVFALLVGVVVGTYSSLFIASPIAFDTIRKLSTKENKEQKIVEQKMKDEQEKQREEAISMTPKEREMLLEEKRRKEEKKKTRKHKKNKNR